MNPFRYFRGIRGRAARGEKGSILILVGLTIVVMFAFLGLSVDAGRLYAAKAELSRAVDAAALAGILEFNGTSAGLTAAENRAIQYLAANEPSAAPTVSANGSANELTVDATKPVSFFFVRVLGIHSANVKAHAVAGFGTLYLDAVMVLDATQSMATGCNTDQTSSTCPIKNAKDAASSFKNIVLGTNPQGNVAVGVTAFRGCFKPTPITATDCVDRTNWVRNLTYTHSQLDTMLGTGSTSIKGGGGNAGTNVCTGLAMGWNILSGTGNHKAFPDSRQYMILLSDGDNYYTGDVTYQAPNGASADSSPTGTTVASNDYSCQPHNDCGSAFTTGTSSPCSPGVNSSTQSSITENWDSTSSWNGGSNWLASSWTTSGSANLTTSNSPQGSSTRHAVVTGPGTSNVTISDNFESGNWSGGSGWDGNWQRSSTSNTAIATNNGPLGGDHARLTRTSGGTYICREVNLTGVDTVSGSFYAKKQDNNFGSNSNDRLRVQVRTSGSCTSSTGWTTLNDYNGAALTTTHAQKTMNLSPYIGQANVYIRWLLEGNNSSDIVYIDNVVIDTTTSVTAGSFQRTFSLSSADASTGTFYAKRNNNVSGAEGVNVQVSTNGSSWTTLLDLTSATLTTSYQQFTIDLTAYAGQSPVYIRFESDMDSSNDAVYIDTIVITRAANSPEDGYLNGGDGSNPGNCDDTPRPRERQLDSRTIKLAQAIKSQGVEIFVIAFAGGVPNCDLGNTTVYNDENASHCNAVDQTTAPQPSGVPSGNGPVGDNTRDNNGANHRLLKCIASNTQGTNDHYFYASSATELQGIFTAIANQIAHRLIE